MQAVEWLSHAEGGKGPQQRMFDEADALKKDVFVARDASFGKGAKVYASLQNHEQLAELLLSSLDRECCMYELIREGRPCKLYLDLEWESESMAAADAHKMLLNVVRKLHTFLQVHFLFPVRCACFFPPWLSLRVVGALFGLCAVRVFCPPRFCVCFLPCVFLSTTARCFCPRPCVC